MMKRMCNLIVSLLIVLNGFSLSAEIERGLRPGGCEKPINPSCSVSPCDLRDIEKKICCVSNQLRACCKKTNKNIIECCENIEIDITECCNEIISTITGSALYNFFISTTQLNMGSTTNINKSGTYLLINVPITITNPPPSGILIDITVGCVLIDLGNECIDANDLVNTVINIDGQSNIVIRNGTIINASQNAIFINNSNNVLLQNLTIENTIGGDSIVIENSTDITLENVTILNNNKNGFTFQNDTDVSLVNSSVIINTATVTNQIGVNVVNTNNLFIDDVKVINNFNGFQFITAPI